MTNRAHLEARRTAQEIARLHRHVRFLRKKGRLSEAQAAATVFQTERVTAVPSGVWRAWQEVLGEVEGLGRSDHAT